MRIVDRHEVNPTDTALISSVNDTEAADPCLSTAVSHPHPTTALLLTSKPVIHRPEAGINTLVDAAAYLFSLMGKLKHIKQYKNLEKLHQELVQEIENFKDTVESYQNPSEYLAEYLPISIYALCMTMDDIILSTSWGGQGQWEPYSLVLRFNDAPISSENFLIILERLVLDPAIYIDVIEFFYICLSLGFKCRNASEFSHEQLEKIMNSLYKRIRAYRGNFNKTLSPLAVRMPRPPRQNKKLSSFSLACLIASGVLAAFILGQYFVHASINKDVKTISHEP